MRTMTKSILLVAMLGLVLPAYAQTKVEPKATPTKVEVKAPVTKIEAKAPVAEPQPAVKEEVKAPVVAAAEAVPVVAQPVAVEMPLWKVVLRYGLELVFTILGIMATAFVTVLMKKYGFETYAAKVNDVLERGIGYAEQMSLKALKLNGKPLGGAEKLELALQFIAEQAKQYKLPDKGKEWWTKKVEGWLGTSAVGLPTPAVAPVAAETKPA